jgi:hypothetical protein
MSAYLSQQFSKSDPHAIGEGGSGGLIEDASAASAPAPGLLLLHPGRAVELRHRRPDLPFPDAAENPTPRPAGLHGAISHACLYQPRQVS